MAPNVEKIDFSSEQTLADLRKLDQRVFTALVAEYHCTLVSLARSIIGDSLAEEVVQESWLSAYRSLPKFEGRSHVKTWLFTIVSNLAKTRVKKESRTVSLDNSELSSPSLNDQFIANGHWRTPPKQWHLDSPEKLLEEDQLRCCIEHTLTILPPRQKAVFTLRDVEQLKLSEICNTLGLTDSNVRVLLHRARLRLMQVIERYQETGQC